jgi:hypothetical protein
MSFPDPPVPGSTVWRGWLTKKGSFMPTLKRRFGALHIGVDYRVTLDYRENETSSTSKGSYTFTAATKCLSSSLSIGTFPPQLCLIVEIDSADGAKVQCCFDSVEARKLFQAAVEWAINAKSHVAAFRSRQEEAKRIVEFEVKKSSQIKQSSTHEVRGDERVRVQQDFASPISQKRGTLNMQRGTLSMEDQEAFMSRLVREFKEHDKQLQHAVSRPQHSCSRTQDWSSTAGMQATFELRSKKTPSLEPTLHALVGSKGANDFVKRLVLEHEVHSAQLASASKYRPEPSLIRGSALRKDLL